MSLASGVSGLYLVGVAIPVFLTVFRGSYGDIKYGWLTGGLALCEAICIATKEYAKQPRPDPQRCGKLDNKYGMPSSHTALVFYLLGFFLMDWLNSLLQRAKSTKSGVKPPPMPQARRPKKSSLPKPNFTVMFCVVLFVAGCSMGWSRVSLGCHSVAQVVVGALTGLTLGLAVRFFMPTSQKLSKFVSEVIPGKNGEPLTMGAALLAVTAALVMAYDIDFSLDVVLHGNDYKKALLVYVGLGAALFSGFLALGGNAGALSILWPLLCLMWVLQCWVCTKFKIRNLAFMWNAMVPLAVMPYVPPVIDLDIIKKKVGVYNLMVTLVALLYTLVVNGYLSNGATKSRDTFFTMLSQIFGINLGLAVEGLKGYIGYFYKAKGIVFERRNVPRGCNCNHHNHNHNHHNHNCNHAHGNNIERHSNDMPNPTEPMIMKP